MITPGPERWERIEAALDAALDLPPAERAVALDAFCAGDPALRAEVERLLRSIDAAGDLFEAPPAAVVSAAVEAAALADRDRLESGDRVGAWRIIDLLGRGGMGAVYRAERADGAFDREVALKVVKRGMDTDEILRRFRRERQILARLEHPNIAGLLDGGATDTGVPYFVMELVRGLPVDVWCDRERLTIEQRLRLFLPVCDAVRHAHASLVVHRDLKPGNILIVDGQPKLLDFGIAKVLHADGDDEEEEPATRMQERRLTPRYAAPEQLRDEPTTTATDVYSLGVILYELLTGRPPYELHGSLAEIERIVCTRAPRSPSSMAVRETGRDGGPETVELARMRGTVPAALRTTLHGDLDAIVMKALEKEPSRRYSSVEALAADIRNHLEGRPVVARPASRWYRLRKFVGRNRATVGLATAAALALVLGSGLALWQAGRARSESRRAQQEAARAAAARDYLIDLFGDLNPDALGGRRTFTLDQIIDLSISNLASLEGEPILQAGVMNAVGSVIANLGEYGKADSLFSEAAQVLGSADRFPELSESLMGRGEIHRRQLAFDSAIVSFERALEIRRTALAGDDPRIPESMVALAAAYYSGDRDEAAESLFVQVLEEESATAQVRAAAFEGLGDLRISRARSAPDSAAMNAAYAEALEMYQQSLTIRRELHEESSVVAARLRFGLSDAHSHLGDHASALRHSEEALTTLRRLYGEEHPDLLPAHYYRSLVLERSGDAAGAADQLARAAVIGERFHGAGYFYTAAARARRAALLLQLDSLEVARAAYALAAAAFRSRIRAHPADTLTIAELAGLEQLFASRAEADGELAEAERGFRVAWSAWSEIGAAQRATASAAALARILERAGMADSAAVWRARAGPARPPAGSN